jgi:transposase
MRPRTAFPAQAAEESRRLMREAKSVGAFRRAQCVWLRAALDMSIEGIAQATGLSVATIRCYHSRYLKRGAASLQGPGRGGRRNENLSPEEESALLEGFSSRAEAGAILEAGEIKRAYEQAIGRKVPRSTVYRVLARHGWRKIVPRPRHAKQDPVRQKAWKKNSAAASRAK